MTDEEPQPTQPRVRPVPGLFLWTGGSVLVWLGLMLGLGGGIGPLPDVQSPESTSAGALEEPRDSTTPALLAIPDRLERGDTLSSVLARNGFSAREIHDVALALSAVMDVRSLRDGDEVDIVYEESGEVGSIFVHHGERETVRLASSSAGWQSERTEVALERRTVSVTGTLENNLFLSVAKLGEEAPLAVAFANVFSWDIDFHTQSRDGDRFSVVIDKLYRDGAFVGYGELRAARYVSSLSGERVFDAFLYEDPSGRRDYYDDEGKSLRKAFLRAPVKFERISSRFSYSRLHPIHGKRMPHLGVDYAAKKGTPVYSVASGVIEDRGVRGGGGNQVTVRHAMGYTSKYLHLSRFAEGLRVGQRVAQKEVIGYVGATGTATAPHLDFRLYRYGKPVNPLTQIFPPGPPVAEELRSDFEAKKAELQRQLVPAERHMIVVADEE